MTPRSREHERLERERQCWNAMKEKDRRLAARMTDDGCIVVGAQGISAIDSSTMGTLTDTSRRHNRVTTGEWPMDERLVRLGDIVRIARAHALGVSVLLAASALFAASQGVSLRAERLTIQIEDVVLFYRIYDAAGGRPGAEQLQREYIDAGTDGLRTFARLRNTTGARIAEAISTRPEIYEDGRRCADVLPRVRHRLEAALRKLAAVYPEARFPPVTIAVGRGRPVAVGGRTTGVQIGLEALCATNFLNANVEDRFVYVIAHEFAHVQQTAEPADFEKLTVLDASLMEGAAEFIGELTAGRVAYSHLGEAVAGRELEIETAFAAEMHSTDLSKWLYNTTAEATGDLGYWVGYRIVKAYYQQARDKRRAVREILHMSDRRAFLVASGWRPGLRLE